MTAGVPGSGIGGFFYLLSALLMPFQEFVSIFQKKSSRASRRKVVRQIMNASGVLFGVWLTGWFISRAFYTVSAAVHSEQHRVSRAYLVMPRINLISGLVTLLSVFLLVQVSSATLRGVRPHTKRHLKRNLP